MNVQLENPRLLDEVSRNVPAGTAVGTIFQLEVEIPSGCVRPFVEVETQDVGVTWLANPFGESALVGRRNVVAAPVQNYRWACDTGPAGSKARFSVIRPATRSVVVIAVIQQTFQLSTDPTNGAALSGVVAAPSVTARCWDGDPIWFEYCSPNQSLFNGPAASGYISLPQTGPGVTTEFGHPPGYCRWFAAYGNTGVQWQIGSPNGGFIVANVAGTQRVSSGIHPMCRVQMLNVGGAATQGSLTWSTQPIAI